MANINRPYAFPAGYRRQASPSRYVPWNGSLKSPSPARGLNGASQVFSVASVPADLSTFIINIPNGRSITFQFVYAGSVQTPGTIKIPLPASGGSTAAQVATQIGTVFSLGSGTPLGGSPTVFQFTYGAQTATTFGISYTVNGAAIAPGGTQATVTVISTVAAFFTLNPVVPGRFGRNFAFLHGV
jgi:hypothetical protein